MIHNSTEFQKFILDFPHFKKQLASFLKQKGTSFWLQMNAVAYRESYAYYKGMCLMLSQLGEYPFQPNMIKDDLLKKVFEFLESQGQFD